MPQWTNFTLQFRRLARPANCESSTLEQARELSSRMDPAWAEKSSGQGGTHAFTRGNPRWEVDFRGLGVAIPHKVTRGPTHRFESGSYLLRVRAANSIG